MSELRAPGPPAGRLSTHSDHHECENCGNPISKKDRSRKGLGVFCSMQCAAGSRHLCECDNPIIVTEDDDGERRCLKCGRRERPDVGVGGPSASRESRPGGAADSGAGVAEFTSRLERVAGARQFPEAA